MRTTKGRKETEIPEIGGAGRKTEIEGVLKTKGTEISMTDTNARKTENETDTRIEAETERGTTMEIAKKGQEDSGMKIEIEKKAEEQIGTRKEQRKEKENWLEDTGTTTEIGAGRETEKQSTTTEKGQEKRTIGRRRTETVITSETGTESKCSYLSRGKKQDAIQRIVTTNYSLVLFSDYHNKYSIRYFFFALSSLLKRPNAEGTIVT